MCLMKKYVMRVIGALSMLSVDKNTKRFINHNIKIWKDFKPNNPDSVILAEFHNITPILIAVSYFSNTPIDFDFLQFLPLEMHF